MRHLLLFSFPTLLLFLLIPLLAGCEEAKLPAPSPPPPKTEAPSPPFLEDFEGKPKISLFPRIGDYRPEVDDDVALPYWRTYIEHVSRTSGVVHLPPPVTRGRVFSYRAVAGLSSIGFFSPLAVEPGKEYRVSALFQADLPKGGSAGIGVLEYDEFLWVAEQFPQSLDEPHRTGTQEGVRLEGRIDWEERAFVFRAGPGTRMVHLVLFREGTTDRHPVLVDDLRMEETGS